MKRNLYLILLMIAIGFFASCEKDAPMEEEILLSPKKSAVLLEEGKSWDTDLIAAQHYVVGKVIVERDGTDLIITYKTDKGAYMTETHLAVEGEFKKLPINRGGNPQIGNFEFSKEHNPGVAEYTIRVDISKFNEVFIAAHAVVMLPKGKVGINCATLEEIELSIPKNEVDIKFKENKILSYYDIKLSNAGWLDGDHLGWCIDNNGKPVGFNPAKLVSSYNSDPTVLADIVPNPDNLDLLNYLMNTYDYENKFKLVQSAIWILMNGEHKNGTGGIDWLYPAERDERDAIVAEVKANGEGYVPGCDDKLVVLIDSGDRDKWQNCFMLIPNKIPPYKDETAWAKGDRFVTRGSWAMYFHLNL